MKEGTKLILHEFSEISSFFLMILLLSKNEE